MVISPMGGNMRMSRRALLTFCIGILLVIGACSAGGNPVTGDNTPDLTNYASSVEGYVYKGGGPVSSGHVYAYDLETLELINTTDVGSDGYYNLGIDEGQHLIFGFNSAGWCPPQLEEDFSTYVNVEPDYEYRVDIELTSNLASGNELIFGFVTSSDNNEPIPGATVSAAGNSTVTDGYGFYVIPVPTGTSQFSISAPGFFDLNENIRDGQANGDYFNTPFFELNPMGTTGSSIGGIVRDVYDGTGLGGVRVTLTLPADINFAPIRFLTNLGGEYRFFNLQEGIYRLYFERPGYVEGSRDGLVIKDQDDVIINVFLHRDNANRASVWGYINSAGAPFPVSGARVTASNPLLGSYRATSNPIGYYRITNVVPDNYTITVVAPGEGVTFYEATTTFQTIVPGDNQLDFALRFVDEGVLRGNVTIQGATGGTYGYPPTGCQITAEKVGGPLSGIAFDTTTDGRGIFVFNGIPMGIYKVSGTAEYTTLEVYYGTLTNVAVNPGTTTVVDLELALP